MSGSGVAIRAKQEARQIAGRRGYRVASSG